MSLLNAKEGEGQVQGASRAGIRRVPSEAGSAVATTPLRLTPQTIRLLNSRARKSVENPREIDVEAMTVTAINSPSANARNLGLALDPVLFVVRKLLR